MALVLGGFAGPDGFGGAFDNTVQTDRAALFHALGGRQGVVKGFEHSGVAGQMALDFTAGAALVGERDATGAASIDRGYLVYADDVTRVLFGPASASARNDAVVAAFVDVESGPVGTGGLEVGPHLAVVPGVSGTTTPRTDAQINDYLGRGGWVRLLDVPVEAGVTEVNAANVTVHTPTAHPYGHLFGTTQTVATGTTTIQFTFGGITESHPVSFCDSANNQLVVPRDGVYSVELYVEWDTNNTGDRALTLHVNGTRKRVDRVPAAPTGSDATAIVIPSIRLAAGDVLTAHGWQSSGGNLATIQKEFTARRVRE